MTLTASQIEQFIHDGFVKLEGAFPRASAEACCDILWRDLGLPRDRPDQWKEPVMRLGMYAEPPFVEAASSARLHSALNQLVGAGRWIRPQALGHMVVRFPAGRPWDDGWHIDASFPPDSDPGTQDYFQWRVNAASRGRAMLMLFLFSDCGPDDAPTQIRIGSHLAMARQLETYGPGGVSLLDLAREGFASSAACEVDVATGEAGTVWLLHPFTVHAGQTHRGAQPRFMAQPGLQPAAQAQPERANSGDTPLERAIQLGLGRAA